MRITALLRLVHFTITLQTALFHDLKNAFVDTVQGISHTSNNSSPTITVAPTYNKKKTNSNDAVNPVETYVPIPVVQTNSNNTPEDATITVNTAMESPESLPPFVPLSNTEAHPKRTEKNETITPSTVPNPTNGETETEMIIKKHKRCIYNNTVYSGEYEEEAEKTLNMLCHQTREISFLIVANWDRCVSTPTTSAIQTELSNRIRHHENSAEFVISIGATSVNDGRCLLENRWANLWSDRSLPWISAIGPNNHDTELANQIEYRKTQLNWMIPSANYVVNIQLLGRSIQIIVLDTCQLSGHTFKWLEKKLKLRTIDSSIVVGYHSIFSKDGGTADATLRKLRRKLEQSASNAIAYISAEESDMQYLTKSGMMYIIAGGGKVSENDTLVPGKTKANVVKTMKHGIMQFYYDPTKNDIELTMVALEHEGSSTEYSAVPPKKTTWSSARNAIRVFAAKIFGIFS